MDDQTRALTAARHLIAHGVPVFRAKPADDPAGGHHGTGYWLPKGWQLTEPDPAVVDAWRDGDALCAVMGHTVDLLDVDPRSGGDASLDRLMRLGLPMSYGETATPSGGQHYFIASLGLRSLDRVLPGLDYKAGVVGHGHGFAFIPPTVKLSKATGELAPYVWEVMPNLEQVFLVGSDSTGRNLAELVRRRQNVIEPSADHVGYTGDTYGQLDADEQRLAVAHQESQLTLWREQLEEAVDWPEGQTDDKGRGWELLCTKTAHVVAMLAVCPWTPLTEDEAQKTYEALLPDAMSRDTKCRGKKVPLEKAAALPQPEPWWTDFLPPPQPGATTPLSDEDYPAFPTDLKDSKMVEWLAIRGLKRQWCYAGAMRWHQFTGAVWVERTEEQLRDAVRKAVQRVAVQAIGKVENRRQMEQYVALATAGRVNSLSLLMRGVIHPDPTQFDAKPDLLSVGNGVLDLRTGAVNPPDRQLYLTKTTTTAYVPGARHDDWDSVLKALDPDVAAWMQIRIGQGLTGHPTSDDVMPVSQGGGSNGKSTFLTALKITFGDHMAFVPDRVLRAGAGDHPTELMTLKGARMAVIDETPEMITLNVGRLKQMLGVEFMTSRLVHKDNVTWQATHSLFLMTNYIPNVTETDHGTWRRLALVKFTKKFPPGDAFRARVTGGDKDFRSAVLAWAVEGAMKWYAAGRVIPPAPELVVADTLEWRRTHDPVMGYINEQLVLDPNACIWSRDLLDDMADWLQVNRHKPWGDKLMTVRLSDHEAMKAADHLVYRRQYRGAKPPEGLIRRDDSFEPLAKAPMIWYGLRFRTKEDDVDDE